MKISASVVVYNTSPKQLENLLESLHVKTVVIDNSLDNALEKVCEIFPHVVYLYMDKNIGFGAGHNNAIFYLKEHKVLGNFHLILNPDIVLLNDTVEILAKYLDNHLDAGLVAPKILNPDGSLQPQCRKLPTPIDMIARRILKGAALKRFNYSHEMRYMDYNTSFEAPFIQASCWMVRSDLYLQIGGFDERFFLYMEDVDFCRRLVELGRVIYLPHTSVIHEWSRASRKSWRFFGVHLKSALRYFVKYM